MLGAALVGDLLLLPALLMSPLGYFFCLGAPKSEVVEQLEADKQQIEVIEETETSQRQAEEEPADTVPAEVTEIPATDKEKELIAAVSDSSVSAEDLEREVKEGPHAALHAKLRSLRRELPQDQVSS